MRNMSGMFSFAFWVIRTLKCGAVIFPKFESAGVHARPYEYLGAPILLIARAPPAFAFHSCHGGMMWHDVISVRILGTPRH